MCEYIGKCMRQHRAFSVEADRKPFHSLSQMPGSALVVESAVSTA